MDEEWQAPDFASLEKLKPGFRSEYHLGDGLWAREWVIGQNEPMETHFHNFGHRTIIGYGSVRVHCWREVLDKDGRRVDGERQWVEVPLEYPVMCSWQPRLWSRWIPKDCRHRFEAITPVAFGMCMFFSRDPATGKVIDYPNGFEAAYG